MKKGVMVIGLFLAMAVGTIVYNLFQYSGTFTELIIRTCGLFSNLFIFMAIISSEYMLQMRKTFGRSFINVHHQLSRIGIALMLIHPLPFVIQKGVVALIPVFYPPVTFLELAGRPALYIVLIAVLAAVYRKKIPRKWKNIHKLNYLAFLLIFFHAWLVGTDLQSLSMQLIWIVMLLIVAAVFIHKHIFGTRKSKQRK
ncbi:ferric reductase [Methanolobus sp. ZRKC2]|uniref:ferric reductase n=1 Tax=Methanolobus sp. ZRKC2 TaxID=3125783 RepID=UPI003248B5A4